VILNGARITVELFCMRLCYSRRLFVMAFPAQKQEAFLAGHVHAFHFFGGVPHRIAYDNLKAAVQRILEGRNRQEQQRFTVFRSHYLFESRFCNRGAGHEKGRVEKGVGYGRRNYLAAVPEFASFDDLNAHLLACCQDDDARTVARQPMTIGEAWELELPELRPLPAKDFECCVSKPVALNGYGQVEFETNRYSVPAEQAYPKLMLRAYPFRIEIVHLDTIIATHPRCYQRKQDLLDPLHYLPLLEQRPGAFEHAKPLRRWRKTWPPIYERLLAHLRSKLPEDEGVREFIRILRLHNEYSTAVMVKAISQALEYGCGQLDCVQICLRHLTVPEASFSALDLTERPELMGVGEQPIDLACYDRLLEGAAQ
jgi:hypothetical protein